MIHTVKGFGIVNKAEVGVSLELSCFFDDWASLIAQLVKICLQWRRPWLNSWVRKIHWRRDRLLTPVFLCFPCGSTGKESACNARDLDLIPGLGRSLGEGQGYPLQYSGLENSMDSIVHGVTKSWTQLSDFHMMMNFVCQLFVFLWLYFNLF